MATYKVIQDIEAEDKLVGPLSLRQFIYAGICALCLYFSFLAATKGVPFLLILFLPPALFTGFFAAPWGRDQPTELWALAKIRFLFKPRRRIWNQSGVKELVTITAPKHVEKNYTNGLTQTEVRNRLNALASTIDSRGWAIKNVGTNLGNQAFGAPESDRLVSMSSLPQEVSNVDISDSDDMLDAQNNPVAQQFDQMINASSQAHRQQIMQQLSGSAPGATPAAGQAQQPRDYWFLNQPETPQLTGDNVVFANPQVVMPGNENNPGVAAANPTMTEAEFAEQLKQQRLQAQQTSHSSHLRTIQPLGSNPVPAPAASDSQAMTADSPQDSTADMQPPQAAPTPDPAKIQLAQNNDLNIATIARIANKQDGSNDDEVVISLH